MALRFLNPPTNQQFYSTFPSFGKNISFQWDELRQDLQLVNPVVRGTVYENQTSKPLHDSVVSGTEWGEFDFHNKYRIFWVKADSELQVQKNTGTAAVPVWTTHLTFATDADGNLILDDFKGAIKTVLETGTNGTTFSNATRLLFNRSSGFYLTSASSDGEPVVNLTQLFGRSDRFTQATSAVEWQIAHNFNSQTTQTAIYDDNNNAIMPTVERSVTFTQPTDAAEWTITHGLGTKNIFADAYDLNGTRITDSPYLRRFEVQNSNTVAFYFDRSLRGTANIQGISHGIDKIDVSDPNTAYFYFSSARKGYAIISTGALGSQSILSALEFTDGKNLIKSTRGNWNDTLFYLSTNANGQPVVNFLHDYVNTRGDTMDGKLTITSGGFYASGGADIIGPVDVTGDFTLTGDLTTTGNHFTNGTLWVDGKVEAEAYYTTSFGDLRDHGQMTGRGDDDHTQYILVDGTRAFTGEQSMGGNKLTNLAQPTSDNDAARLTDIPAFYGVTFKLSDSSFVDNSDTLEFDISDFSMTTPASGKPRVSVTASAGNAITFAESKSSAAAHTDNYFKVDSTYFYMQGGLSNPIISLHTAPGAGLSSIDFKDGTNTISSDALNFNDERFYLSTNAAGEPVVNFIDAAFARPELQNVTSENFNAGNHTTRTSSHETLSGKNRALLVCLTEGNSIYTTPINTTSSVTYAGQEMTMVAWPQPINTLTDPIVTVWGMVNPPVGTHDVTLTRPSLYGTSVVFQSCGFYNVDQDWPFRNFEAAQTNSHTSTPSIDILTSSPDSLLFGTVGGSGADTAPISGTSGQRGVTTIAGQGYGAAVGVQNSSGKNVTDTMSWLMSSSDGHTEAVVEIAAVGAVNDSKPVPAPVYLTPDFRSDGRVPMTNALRLMDAAAVMCLTFNDDGDTGLVHSADQLEWRCGNVPMLTLSESSVDTVTLGGNCSLLIDDGSAVDASSRPALAFNPDTDTGMWQESADTLSLGAGSTEMVRLVENGATGDHINLVSSEEATDGRVGINLGDNSTRPGATLHVQGDGLFENGKVVAAGFYSTGAPGELLPVIAGSNITVAQSDAGYTVSSSAGGAITFAETESGGYSNTATTLKVNSDHFYLSSSGGDGNPILSLQPNFETGNYVAPFTTPATEWTVNHNFNSTDMFWAAYDDGDQALIPARIDVSDPNTAYFYFAETTAGRAIVGGQTVAQLIPQEPVTMQFTLRAGADDTFTLIEYSAGAWTIDTAYHRTDAGTISADVLIDGSSVTGLLA
jgi:hypothetical protein